MKPRHDFIGKRALWLAPIMGLLLTGSRVLGVTGPHGTVDLIADQTSVQPARPFWVGLHFQLEPGWHIYWTNPGDSGEPPRVKWNLPPGFQAGPLQWPVPRRIEDHSLIDYGYQNEVLLPVEIRSPASLGGGSTVQLSAMVHWLVCREVCIPGRTALELTLPIHPGTPGALSNMHASFVKARADLPQPAPKSWKVTANVDQHLFILNVDTGKRETGATFFPFEPNQIENAAPQKASIVSHGVQISLLKSDQLLKLPPRLTGVIVFASGKGYVIEAPVVTSK